MTPRQGEVVELIAQSHGGYYVQLPVEFECNLPPDLSISLMVQDGANWWPQPWPVAKMEGAERYCGSVGLGAVGVRTIHIVRANAFGMAVVNFHKSVIARE